MPYELPFNFLLIAVGVFILIRSGVYIVRSLTQIAGFLKISEFTLSFILMAFATTLPELSVGLNSALEKQPLISLGNIMGANILNLSLTLGLVALISGKLIIGSKSKETAISHHWFTFLLGISPLLLMVDLKLSRLDGLILICLFLVYLVRSFHLRRLFHEERSFWSSHFRKRKTVSAGFKHLFKNLVIFAVASGFLIFSAFLVVQGAKAVSLRTGLPEFLVGIFIVAFGTTLPELSFGLRAAFSGHGELSLGDLFGATAFNSTWILGIVALISPIKVLDSFNFLFSAFVMALVLFLANLFLQSRESVSRKEGLLLIGIYVSFLVFQLIYRIQI